jgi:calcineurin-like phosphoesterase family protein
MENTWFVADPHWDHPNIIIHCNRPYLKAGDLNDQHRWVSEEIKQARTDEMNADMLNTWNSFVGKKDTTIIVGDYAWKNHRKWINETNGKKIFLIGSHDKMPMDCLDLFKPDWMCDDMAQPEVVKTLCQFREVHTSLIRKICGQDMHLYHWPCSSWQGKPRNSWFVHGHVHGRRKVSLPGEIGGGLTLDVGWDVFKRPINFDELKAEMMKKFDLGATRYDLQVDTLDSNL